MTSEAPDAGAPARAADPVDPDETGPDATGDQAGPPSEPPEIPKSVITMRRTRKALWIAVAVALPVAMLIAVLATSPSARSRAVKSPLVGKPAPPAEGTTIDGSRASLADLRGQWVVVNFFATWCVPCRQEHPELVRFDEAHSQAGDAAVVSVLYDDDPDTALVYFETNGGNWPVVLDTDGEVAVRYGVTGVPETYIVAPGGSLLVRITGGVTQAILDQVINNAEADIAAAQEQQEQQQQEQQQQEQQP
jgi:cytochrome c biogenesis protein CcmG, thiol:disulfide interchange protein DsbE